MLKALFNRISRAPAVKKLAQVFNAIIHHPAAWLGAGNFLLGYHVSGIEGAAAAGIAELVVLATIARAALKGEPAHLPFFVLSALTVTTGVWSLLHALAEGDAGKIWSATALIGWGVGHAFTGAQIGADWAKANVEGGGITRRFNRAARWAVNVLNLAPKNTNIFCYGGADMAAICGSPVFSWAPFAPALGRLIKVFVPMPENHQAIKTRAQSINWHITPQRIMGAGYMLNGFLALGADAGFAVPNLLFGLGLFHFDKKQNAHFVADAKTGFRPPQATPAP